MLWSYLKKTHIHTHKNKQTNNTNKHTYSILHTRMKYREMRQIFPCFRFYQHTNIWVYFCYVSVCMCECVCVCELNLFYNIEDENVLSNFVSRSGSFNTMMLLYYKYGFGFSLPFNGLFVSAFFFLILFCFVYFC